MPNPGEMADALHWTYLSITPAEAETYFYSSITLALFEFQFLEYAVILTLFRKEVKLHYMEDGSVSL